MMKLHLFVVCVLVPVMPLPESIAAEPSPVAAEFVDGVDRVSAERNKPLLLKFWATWCVACLQEMPEYLDLFNEYSDSVEFLAVNVAVSDPIERVQQAVVAHNLAMPVAYDASGKLWNRFGVIGTPTYVLVDDNNKEIFRSYGHDEKLVVALERATAAMGPAESPSQEPGHVDRDASAPSTIIDVVGRPVDLSVADDEVLVAYHLAVWCTSYVKDSYPELSRRCEAFHESVLELAALDAANTRFVGFVSGYSTEVASALRFKEIRGIDHLIVFDRAGHYAANFGSRDFPHLTIAGPGGKVIYSGNSIPQDIRQLIESRATRK